MKEVSMSFGKQGRLWLTVFLGLLSAMAPFATDMYLPALPQLESAFQTTTSLVQMTLTATMLGMALGQFFIGPLSDRFGRRVPLLFGMAAFALSSLACVFVQDIYLFLVMRFIQGFSGASGIVISRAIARDLCDGTDLTKFFAILMAVNGLAPILSPIIGGQVLSLTSWRGVFVLLTVIGLLLFSQSVKFRESLAIELRAKDIAGGLKYFPHLLTNRYFVGHCLIQFFTFGGFFAYIAGSSFVFQNIYGISPQGYSFVFGTIGAGMMALGILPARLAGRVRDETILCVSLCLQLIAAVILLIVFLIAADSIYLTYLLLLIAIPPLSLILTTSFSLALSHQGRNAGSASALLGFFQMILGGMMTPVVGIAGSHTAMPMSIIMVIAFALSLGSFLALIKGRS